VLVVARRNHDDWHCAALSQLHDHFYAVDVRQAQIQEDQLRLGVSGLRQRLRAIDGLQRLESVVHERRA
jgi:hypothetical protein